MDTGQLTTTIINVLTGGGFTAFLYWVIRGLKSQIDALNKTVEIQQKTLEVMKTQVLETEKVGNIYRQFLEDFPKALENYRALHTRMMEDQIKLLEKAIEQKDERLKETAEIELEKLKLQQRALDDIPKLLGQITDTARILDQRLSTVNQLGAYNEPALNDWMNKGSTLQAMMDKESALYLLLSALAENDRKVVLAVWRFLDAGATPTTLKEIASKLNLHEFVVSNALDRLIRQNCAEMIVSAEEPTKYIALAPGQIIVEGVNVFLKR